MGINAIYTREERIIKRAYHDANRLRKRHIIKNNPDLVKMYEEKMKEADLFLQQKINNRKLIK